MSKYKSGLFLFGVFIAILLVSCTSAPDLFTTPSPSPVIQASLAPSPTPEDVYKIHTWVSNATPSGDEKVLLFGTLKKDGVFLGHLMMKATWPDKDIQEGVPNCYVQVLYTRAVCIIHSGKYPRNEFVPIKIEFTYNGMIFSDKTGFTPE